MQDYHKLDVYNESSALAIDIYNLIKNMNLDFRLKSQIIASSSSIPSNLMEFAAMESKNQQAQILRVCIGEAGETEFRLEYLYGIGLLKEEQFNDFFNRVTNLEKKLHNLLKKVKKDK